VSGQDRDKFGFKQYRLGWFGYGIWGYWRILLSV